MRFIFDKIYEARNCYDGDFLFILGSGRSGNTLLRKLLVERFPVYIPAETYVIADALCAFNSTRQLAWTVRVRLVLSFFEYQKDFKTISRKGLYPVFQKCLSLPVGRQKFGDVLFTMWEFLAQDAGVSFVLPGDKTPYNMASINLIKRNFPRGSYIFLTRHPYDVCDSYVKMGRYADVASAARRWKMAHQNFSKLIKSSPNLKTKLIRYESLVSNPKEEVDEVGKWLKLDEREFNLEEEIFWGDMDVYRHISGAKSDVNSDSIGKGARSLDKHDKHIIKDIVGDMSIRFGYQL